MKMKLSILLLFLLSNNVLVGSEISLYTDKQLAQKLKNEAKQVAEREAMMAVINKVLSTDQIEYLGEGNAKKFVEDVLKKKRPDLKLIDGNSFWSKIKEWIARMTGNEEQLVAAKKDAADFIQNVKYNLELSDKKNINKDNFITETLQIEEARIDITDRLSEQEKLLKTAWQEYSNKKKISLNKEEIKKNVDALKLELSNLDESTKYKSLEDKIKAANTKMLVAEQEAAAKKLRELEIAPVAQEKEQSQAQAQAQVRAEKQRSYNETGKRIQEAQSNLEKMNRDAKHNIATSAEQQHKVLEAQAHSSGLTHATPHIPAPHIPAPHLGIA